MSDPLMKMQLTEFKCGGFVIGVAWNHGAADTCGLAQFLRAVGELACGLPSPSVVPVRRYGESMSDIPDVATGALKAPVACLKHVDFAYCDITIPWGFGNRVKAEFVSRNCGGGGRHCSVFDMVTAAIWQCRTRAIHGRRSSGDALAALLFAVNVRKHVGAKDGYYGNCITRQVVAATADAVANGDIVDVVTLINDAKERVPELLRNKQRQPQAEGVDGGGLFVGAMHRLYVSSWAGLGLDGVDFGRGRPARVVPNMEVTVMPSCFPYLPCSRSNGHGVNAVAWCVTDEQVDVFRAELARLQ